MIDPTMCVKLHIRPKIHKFARHWMESQAVSSVSIFFLDAALQSGRFYTDIGPFEPFKEEMISWILLNKLILGGEKGMKASESFNGDAAG